MLVLRLVHWAVACLAYISCTGVLVPCVKALQFVTALKAEVLLAEVPVCLCLSHGARVCRSTVCLLDELLPSGNRCSGMLQGMIAQMLLLAQETRLE